MKKYLEQRLSALLQLHLSDQQVHCLLMCDLYDFGKSSWQYWKMQVVILVTEYLQAAADPMLIHWQSKYVATLADMS